MSVRLIAMLRTIEDKFVQQFDRIAFHQNDAGNEYKVREGQLSTLMLDKSISDEKHLEYARAIITLADSYERSFLRSLQTLNSEIDRELLALQQMLNTPPKPENQSSAHIEKWIRLSRELLEARVTATSGIIQQTEFDKFIPTMIVRDNGRCDLNLSSEETTQFQLGLEAYASSINKAYEDDQRIQQERKPLTNSLLSVGDDTKAPTQASAPQPPKVKSVHPLEGKVWFRFLKVAYIALWIAGLGLSAIVAYDSDNFSLFLFGAVIVAIVLFVVKTVFNYIILGRTTATEKSGKGFADLEELRNDFAVIQANSPEVYRDVVAPFLDSWKVQYGRRVPVQAVGLLQQRVAHEMTTLKERRQQIVDKAACEGATIEISKLRESLDQTKAAFRGPDRQQYVRQLNNFVMSLEAKYGTAIPLDEASKLLDRLEEDI